MCCDRLLKTYEVLRKAYQPLFSNIVWTGDSRPEDLPGDEVWVECDGKGGTTMQACLANVMQVRPESIRYFLKNGSCIQARSFTFIHTCRMLLWKTIASENVFSEEFIDGGFSGSPLCLEVLILVLVVGTRIPHVASVHICCRP